MATEADRQAGRAMVRLLYIAHHQGPSAASEAVENDKFIAPIPPAELAKVLAGSLYAATVDLADLHGVPIEQFLRTLAFQVETAP